MLHCTTTRVSSSLLIIIVELKGTEKRAELKLDEDEFLVVSCYTVPMLLCMC